MQAEFKERDEMDHKFNLQVAENKRLQGHIGELKKENKHLCRTRVLEARRGAASRSDEAPSLTPSMSKEEQERLGVDISLFQEGIIKPFKEHVILDKELYAKNQKKQTRYTEEALLKRARLAAADDDLADAGDAEAAHAARRKLRTKAAAAGVARRPAPPAAKPAQARAARAARAAAGPPDERAPPAPPAVEEDVEDVPRLGADDGGDVEDVALDEWRGATDADREASWRDGEKFSHEQPVDWSSVTLPKGFPNPSELAAAPAANELTKACDWLFKHKYAGDLDQVVRAFDKGDYDDERWNEEFHAPRPRVDERACPGRATVPAGPLDGDGDGEHESSMSLPAPALDGGNNDEPANRRGRWHGLVYVPVPRSRRFVGVAGRAWRGTPRGELCRDAHLSLSRPFGLLRHEVEPFLARLRSASRAALRRSPSPTGGAALELDSEDGARRFEALRVDASPALHALVDAVDDALVAFGRPAPAAALPQAASTSADMRSVATRLPFSANSRTKTPVRMNMRAVTNSSSMTASTAHANAIFHERRVYTTSGGVDRKKTRRWQDFVAAEAQQRRFEGAPDREEPPPASGENEYLTQYATDNRSKCKLISCKKAILLGELRIGKIPPRVNNEKANKRVHWHDPARTYHPDCIFASFDKVSKRYKPRRIFDPTSISEIFGSASSTRREPSTRPKIGRSDFDATELERFDVRSGRPEGAFGAGTKVVLKPSDLAGFRALHTADRLYLKSLIDEHKTKRIREGSPRAGADARTPTSGAAGPRRPRPHCTKRDPRPAMMKKADGPAAGDAAAPLPRAAPPRLRRRGAPRPAARSRRPTARRRRTRTTPTSTTRPSAASRSRPRARTSPRSGRRRDDGDAPRRPARHAVVRATYGGAVAAELVAVFGDNGVRPSDAAAAPEELAAAGVSECTRALGAVRQSSRAPPPPWGPPYWPAAPGGAGALVPGFAAQRALLEALVEESRDAAARGAAAVRGAERGRGEDRAVLRDPAARRRLGDGELFEELGATFVKLGQLVASSPTLFPEAWTAEFEKTLDGAPPVPYATLRDSTLQELDLREEARRLELPGLPRVERARPGGDVPAALRGPVVQGSLDDDASTGRAADADAPNPASEAAVATVIRTWARSVVEHDFFHADVHGGNVLLLRNGTVGIIDFASTKTKYKAVVDALAASSDVGGLQATLTHLLSDAVPQVVSRNVVAHFARAVAAVAPPERLESICSWAVAAIQPQKQSFEDADHALRHALYDCYLAEGPTGQGRSHVKIAEAFLEDDESVDAETYVNRASGLMHAVDGKVHWALQLRYRVTLARTLEARRKFLDASMRYYELSQARHEEVNQDDLLALLSAVTCALLGNAGPQRSRILGCSTRTSA
ncbi:hypothetical protein JL720_12654 [Aureococcus anophagefferens]|nr:hypothetical protein JL720_12654 [Aureococcus anophagefferens]